MDKKDCSEFRILDSSPQLAGWQYQSVLQGNGNTCEQPQPMGIMSGFAPALMLRMAQRIPISKKPMQD